MRPTEEFDRFMYDLLNVVPAPGPTPDPFGAGTPAVIPPPQPPPFQGLSPQPPWASIADQVRGTQEMREANARQAALEQDRRKKIVEMVRGLGETVDLLGGAFDRRLTDAFVPHHPVQMWSPNPNPGIQSMVNQLLFAAGRA